MNQVEKQKDLLKIDLSNQFFRNKKSTKSILDIPIPYKEAKSATELYKTKSTGSIADIQKLLSTESVGFDLPAFVLWLNDTAPKADANRLRICFGVYDEAFVTNRNHPRSLDEIGKLTVFIWLYKDDLPARYLKKHKQEEDFVDPYNLGQLHP